MKEQYSRRLVAISAKLRWSCIVWQKTLSNMERNSFFELLYLLAGLRISRHFLLISSHLSEENENAMQWIQMGRTEEDKLVLQLGFKVSQQTNEHVYELRQAFVSQPV